MAYVVNVQPIFNNAVRVASNDAMDGTILSNNLTPEVLLNIWNTYPEMRAYLFLQWVDIIGSYPLGTIDASLLHAYDSSEVSHNPNKTDYVTGSAGKHLNDVATIANATKNGLVMPNVLPTKIFDFAATKVLPADCTFSRNSIASYVDKYGTIRYAAINEPRFTHDPVSLQSLGILIEESRTNYHNNSTNINSASSITRTTGQLAPDGTLTASLIVKNSTSNGAFSPDSIGTITNGFYIKSLFVKPNNSTSSIITFESVGGTNGAGGSISFNALTKLFFGDTTIPISYGYQDYPNGWIRVWVCVEKTDTKIVGNSFFLGGYGGTSAPDNSTLVWGFQFEEGKCLTSYIRTSGTAYTRINEALAINNSVVPKREGTFVLTGVMPNTWERKEGGYRKVLVFGNSELIGYIPNGEVVSYDGVTPSMISNSSTLNDSLAIAYNSSTRRASINGGNISSSIFSNPNVFQNQCYIGSANGQNSINGTIRRLTIYSKMLADPDLIALSTKGRLSGFEANGQAANSTLNEGAFLGVKTLMSFRNRQEFTIHGTGASESRNIRRPYDFTFEIVDSSGVTTISAQPSASCTANSDNTLTANIPVGKSLVYAITPAIYDV